MKRRGNIGAGAVNMALQVPGALWATHEFLFRQLPEATRRLVGDDQQAEGEAVMNPNEASGDLLFIAEYGPGEQITDTCLLWLEIGVPNGPHLHLYREVGGWLESEPFDPNEGDARTFSEGEHEALLVVLGAIDLLQASLSGDLFDRESWLSAAALVDANLDYVPEQALANPRWQVRATAPAISKSVDVSALTQGGALRRGKRSMGKLKQLPAFAVERLNPARLRNLDHRDAKHPIEVSHYWQGRKGYETHRQRAIRHGQRDLFDERNPAQEFDVYCQTFGGSMYVATVVAANERAAIAEARRQLRADNRPQDIKHLHGFTAKARGTASNPATLTISEVKRVLGRDLDAILRDHYPATTIYRLEGEALQAGDQRRADALSSLSLHMADAGTVAQFKRLLARASRNPSGAAASPRAARNSVPGWAKRFGQMFHGYFQGRTESVPISGLVKNGADTATLGKLPYIKLENHAGGAAHSDPKHSCGVCCHEFNPSTSRVMANKDKRLILGGRGVQAVGRRLRRQALAELRRANPGIEIRPGDAINLGRIEVLAYITPAKHDEAGPQAELILYYHPHGEDTGQSWDRPEVWIDADGMLYIPEDSGNYDIDERGIIN